ncbi:MAG: hypothetical protein Q8942_13030 [Bacillota bacterium]|nr:hypothetical protein [Bacillota bacterium]
MVDFLQAAFPWIAMGIAIAIAITYMSSKQKRQVSKIENSGS